MKQHDLRRILHYDPATGAFTWIKSRGRAKAGSVAGSVNVDGYIVIAGQYAHRLAFLYMTGEVPPLVDHRDRDTSNNRWDNLRAATKAVNAINSKTSIRNASGLPGVSWHSRSGKWQAHCGRKYLGVFDTKETAHSAYRSAAQGTYGVAL